MKEFIKGDVVRVKDFDQLAEEFGIEESSDVNGGFVILTKPNLPKVMYEDVKDMEFEVLGSHILMQSITTPRRSTPELHWYISPEMCELLNENEFKTQGIEALL